MDQVCDHSRVALVNPWELLRKFRCENCAAVLTCGCSADIATYVLPHQALRGVDADTREDVPVTDTLVEGICFDCRGETPPPFPHAPQRNAASAIHRYYWHELWTDAIAEFLNWCRENGLPLLDAAGDPQIWTHRKVHPDEFKAVKDRVLARIRAEHEELPKYDVSRPSDADVLDSNNIEVTEVPACYLEPTRDGRVRVLPLGATDSSQALPVEDYVAAVESAGGREAILLESRPFHCLFGSLMWMWVEDPTDPRGIPQYFGRRDPPDTSGTKQTPESWMDQLLGVVMPRDFGSPNHASRRRDALESHMATLPDETQELLWLYDYWLGPSWKLRQYLWAHEPEAEATARTLIRVLGAATVKQVLRFMATNYWERYLGWPDLLTWRDGDDGPEDVMLIEVKSRGDRLSEDQRTWIQLNATELGLPFRLAKVHRVERLTT